MWFIDVYSTVDGDPQYGQKLFTAIIEAEQGESHARMVLRYLEDKFPKEDGWRVTMYRMDKYKGQNPGLFSTGIE